MKLCFPITDNQGMDSQIFEHFGSAPMFLLVDSQTGEIWENSNRDKGHSHGNCQPLRALAGMTVDAIVVSGIGKGALNGLNQAGLKVLQAHPGTIADNLAHMETGQLKELTPNDVCGGHAGSHGHSLGGRPGHGHGHGCGC
jgi:predicted Fe-Mo cluster-binding NifX family protein